MTNIRMARQLDLLLATLLVILTFLAAPCTSFTPVATSTVSASTTTTTKTRSLPSLNLSNKEEEGGTNKEESNTKNPVELASWYAVEAFGKVFGSKQSTSEITSNSSNKDTIDFTKPPSSLEETLKRIQIDNDRSYFLSGDVDKYIYTEQCTFADPFVSFDGRERFIDNLANLGSFITKYSAKMIKYDAEKDGEEIDTKVMVKLELNLPWKPVLAWPWGVKYLIDPDTFLITSHIESWDIAPWEGVKQIFRPPTVKIND